jgi:hypothetical protein
MREASDLTFTWHRSVDDVRQAWEACMGPAVLRSYELQKAVELSNFPGVEHHYLVGSDANGPKCVVACFKGRVSLVTLASPKLQRWADFMKRFIPGFMEVSLFVLGSAVSTYGDLFGLKNAHDKAYWTPTRVRSIVDEATRYGKSLKLGFFLAKEFDEERRVLLQTAMGKRMMVTDSLPLASLMLQDPGMGLYPDTICSKYRNKYKKRVSVAARSGITWEVRNDCAGLEDKVYELYCQVLNHSDYVFERVNKEFFLRVTEVFGSRAFYILGLQGEEKKLISVELVLVDDDGLEPFYSGFDYSQKHQADVYFNSFYKVVEETEKRGFRRVSLGQTAYEVKAELGAMCSKLYIGVYHANPLIHRLLGYFEGVIKGRANFPKREVFKIPPPPKKTQPKKQPPPAAKAEPASGADLPRLSLAAADMPAFPPFQRALNQVDRMN